MFFNEIPLECFWSFVLKEFLVILTFIYIFVINLYFRLFFFFFQLVSPISLLLSNYVAWRVNMCLMTNPLYPAFQCFGDLKMAWECPRIAGGIIGDMGTSRAFPIRPSQKYLGQSTDPWTYWQFKIISIYIDIYNLNPSLHLPEV